jgi:signal transduction histidine kinase
MYLTSWTHLSYWFLQVIRNFMSNAIEFSPNGSTVTIRISHSTTLPISPTRENAEVASECDDGDISIVAVKDRISLSKNKFSISVTTKPLFSAKEEDTVSVGGYTSQGYLKVEFIDSGPGISQVRFIKISHEPECCVVLRCVAWRCMCNVKLF